ncbi:MAG: beta-ketoacyl-[acyl-carrier-protein] synthase family protein [Planctomycetes bacterium]|nr:beta-ketoacyl-[acyl-carrier-protein] synthase family protein [Planctomycetota bacterium]
MKRRVVITGLGAITPYGEGAERYWENLRAGRSAVGSIRLFKPERVASRVAAEVHDWSPGKIVSEKELKRLPRVAIMAIGAAREAFADARLDPTQLEVDALRRVAVILGTSSGGIEFAEEQYRRFFTGEVEERCYPFAVSSAFVGMLSSEVSIAFGLRGLSHVVSTGCTSSTDAIGHALRTIQYGTADVVVSGGADCCITPGILECYGRMKCVSTHFNDTPDKASRPFNRDRDGFVIGEGSWIVILEELERAVERGAPIYAEVLGYGATCDAFHRVQIMPTGEESARAMTIALEDAGLTPDEVRYINLHGTSTPLNDKTETAAIKLAFGRCARAVPASATKSLIGHPQGAAGAAGVAATLMSIRDSFLHPTINYETPDPECDLDYVPNTGRARDVEIAMCNTIAFGSKNAALVLGRWEGGRAK